MSISHMAVSGYGTFSETVIIAGNGINNTSLYLRLGC